MTDDARLKLMRYSKFYREFFGWVLGIAFVIALIGGLGLCINHYGDEERCAVYSKYKPEAESWLRFYGYTYDKLKYIGTDGDGQYVDHLTDMRSKSRIFEATDLVDSNNVYIGKAHLYFDTPPEIRYSRNYAYLHKIKRIE